MVLIINEQLVKESPSSTTSLYNTFPRLKETSSSLTSIPTESMGGSGVLYLRPREFAVTVPHDDAVQILGTDDATTSVMAVLRHTGSGAVGLCHFDRCSHEQCLTNSHICSHEDGIIRMLGRITDFTSPPYTEGRLELCIVGGFHDRRSVAEKVVLSVINAFHKYGAQFHLMVLCTGECNTTIRGNIPWPVIKGIGVNTQTGKIFPAVFSDKGPYLVIRSTRIFTGAEQMVDIYDCQLGVLKFGPFNYQPHVGVELLLQQSDDVLLKCLSTSPEVEGPGWIKLVREVLRYIKENPFPDVTLFPDNQPHYFRRNRQGIWERELTELSNNNNGTPDANLVNSVMASAAAVISPATPAQTVVTGGNAVISVPSVPSTPASAAWTPPISSSAALPSAAQAPPLQAHQIHHASPNINLTPQQQQQQQAPPPPQQQQSPQSVPPPLWCATTTPTHGAPPRYGSFQVDCKLKTHLAGSMVPSPHYEDQFINTKPERFMPAWATSQL